MYELLVGLSRLVSVDLASFKVPTVISWYRAVLGRSWAKCLCPGGGGIEGGEGDNSDSDSSALVLFFFPAGRGASLPSPPRLQRRRGDSRRISGEESVVIF